MKLNFVLAIIAFIAFSISTEVLHAQNRRHGGRTHHVKKVTHTRTVHRKVVVRKAHVRYASLPRWKSVVKVVPSTAIIIKTRKNPYYFHDGVYYAQRNNNYVVVRPARGIRIKTLPVGHRPFVLDQRNYFYYYGTFYIKSDNTDEYEVIDAPIGAVVDALPDGYEVKNIDGTEYYVLDDVYYAEVEDSSMADGIGYEVVKI
jgi:hypothetical protein